VAYGGSHHHHLADYVFGRAASPTAMRVIVEVKAVDESYDVHQAMHAIKLVQRRLLLASMPTSEVARRTFDVSLLAFVILDMSVLLGDAPDSTGLEPWLALETAGFQPRVRRMLWTSTAGEESSLRKVITLQRRAQRLAKMSAEQRSTYDRIVALRESIGPGDFDIASAIREIREGG
jgi:hypothetical protein